ncbi:MAG: S8 family serine peptidase [Bacteroidales bacterium]
MYQRSVIILLIFLTAVFNIYGQQGTPRQTKLKSLQETLKFSSTEILDDMAANRQLAHSIAGDKGWVTRQVLPNGDMISLEGVDSNGLPIYYTTEFNLYAAATTGTDKLWTGGGPGLNLTGGSPFMDGKLAIWDGGNVRGGHQEISRRSTANNPDADISNHATHVAGTMIAAGVNPLAKGMAHGANDIMSWDFSNDGEEMTDAADSLLVSNHSYGRLAGWRFNSDRDGTSSDPNWEWRGDVSVSKEEDYIFGYYSSRARLWDMIAYYSPYYLIVKSAGNNRGSNGPSVGQPYWHYDETGDWTLANRTQDMSSNDGYNTVAAYGNAKNILSVGAVSAIKNGYRKPEEVIVSGFSSWGPTDDGRIKPDIVANGVSVYSASSSGNADYTTMSGTSMSAPNTSGTLFLLQEHYHQLNDTFMLSSTLKGLVCHTANPAGNPGPDYIYGWGLLDAESAARAITDNGNGAVIEENTLIEQDTLTLELTASGREALSVTIAWTDPEADPLEVNQEVLNNRTPRLVNDLDLRVTDMDSIFKPWVLDVENPEAFATTGDNIVDNIEQIYIEHPVPGKTYTITVTHKNDSLVRGSQNFSLIATGVGGEPLPVSEALDEKGIFIQDFNLNTLDNEQEGGCHTYRDFTNMKTVLKAGGSYPFEVNTGYCEEYGPHVISIYADWNSDGIFDEDEIVATSAVKDSPGSFTGTLNVPIHVGSGSTAILRVVAKETDHPDEMAPDLDYQRGETQDYLLVFDRATTDVQISGLPGLSGVLCPSEHQSVTVSLENNGSEPVSEILLQAVLYEDEQPSDTIKEVYSNELDALSADVFRFNDTFTTLPDSDYMVEVSVMQPETLLGDHGTLQVLFQTGNRPPPPSAKAVVCQGEEETRLSAQGAGTVYWYSDAEDGDLLAVGSDPVLDHRPESAKVFAGFDNLYTGIGPKQKEEYPWTNGTYTRATAHPVFTTHVPLVIRSARLYIGHPGEVTFSVVNYQTGEVVSIAELNVTATRSTPTDEIGAPDDPEDEGRVYQLNLVIPEPGKYRLRISYGSRTTIFRSAGNTSNPYPYEVPDVMEITETSASESTDYYYWLYDTKIEAYGCASELQEVEIEDVENPVVKLDDWSYLDEGQLILDARNPGADYRWSTGARTQKIAPVFSGNYWVVVTNEQGCQARDEIKVTETSAEEPLKAEVRVYPNPTDHLLIIESPGKIKAELFSVEGRLHRTAFNEGGQTLMDVSDIQKGIYLLRLTDPDNGNTATYKVMIR